MHYKFLFPAASHLPSGVSSCITIAYVLREAMLYLKAVHILFLFLFFPVSRPIVIALSQPVTALQSAKLVVTKGRPDICGFL